MKEYIKINQLVYDALANEYAFRRDNIGLYSESTEYLGNSLLKHASTKELIHVLEVGPGAGQILKYFEDHGCRTVGIELSDAMCQLCKIQSPNSIIIHSDINEIKLYGEQFDLIYMGALIHLFPLEDATKLIRKVWSWLKEDGCIFINTTCHEKSEEGFYRKQDYVGESLRFRRHWNESDFECFVTSNGFSILEKLYTDEQDRGKNWIALIAKKEKADEKD